MENLLADRKTFASFWVDFIVKSADNQRL